MSTDNQRRAIGKVISVSAEKLIVELHRGTDNFTVVGFDDVHYVARLGSFVMIPVLSDYVVTEVIGLWEKDPTTGRTGRDGREELDKAASAKFLELVPVGMLPQRPGGEFRFGVSIFPALYADALYVLDEELDRIFEVDEAEEPVKCGDQSNRTRFKALSIGSSVVFKGYDVKVRVDEFFGGHVAVLGNTGSGKSCTVTTILQSLFAKKSEYLARGATFLLLDVNGEYRQAFDYLPQSIGRLYLRVSQSPDDEPPIVNAPWESTAVFRLPQWFMSVEEWELLLRASEKTQQPILRTALGLASLFAGGANSHLEGLKNHIIASCFLTILQNEAGNPAKSDRIRGLLVTFHTTALCHATVGAKIKISYGEMVDATGLGDLLTGLLRDDVVLPGYTHTPFSFDDLELALDLALLYEEAHGNRQIRDYCSQLLTRFKWVKTREEFAFLRVPPANLTIIEKDIDLFVERLIGLDRCGNVFHKNAQIIILDMNEAADEVVEVASAVIVRLIFDRLRKADPRNELPVNVILEEAHRYISEHPPRHAIDASKIFERIAKEGRKYGMFLTVASQRPSELSKTVLSQCSNFVIHRIQNPDDLSHIRQMTPFISDSVLKRLPSLPKQHALMFGNAVNLPTTFKVRNVDKKPKSDDARIRELWFIDEKAPVNLKIPPVRSQPSNKSDQKPGHPPDGNTVPRATARCASGTRDKNNPERNS